MQINKGQIALIENMKQRIGFNEAHRGLIQESQFLSGRRMRRSRSSSVQINSASLKQAFESETKINDLFSNQGTDPYQMHTMQPRGGIHNIHEISEERKSEDR